MNLTKIDWFGFRTKGEVPEVIEGLRGSFGSSAYLVKVQHRKSGWMGFKSSANVLVGDMQVGLLAFGGDSQRGNVSVNISGAGCGWIEDWDTAQDAVQSLPDFELRRVDIALDTFKRESSHEQVVQAHRDGLFTLSGRPPNMTRIEPEDSLHGRTAYVGSRENAKFFRAYEKGFEMAKGYPLGSVSTIDGVPIEDIYRLELELKAKQGPLPVDLIDRRDEYFAGAYPYLQTVIDVKPEIFIQPRERAPQRALEAMLATARHQWGNTLFTALVAHQGDITAVWDKIVGSKHNRALLEAGVLLVDHD